MIALVVWLLLWLVCALIAYFLVQRDERRTSGRWTQLDRLACASLALFSGPWGLLAIGVITLGVKLGKTTWAKREARW